MPRADRQTRREVEASRRYLLLEVLRLRQELAAARREYRCPLCRMVSARTRRREARA